MHYGSCGCYCEPEEVSKSDREALLKEQEAILEAKLATVRLMMKNMEKEEEEK